MRRKRDAFDAQSYGRDFDTHLNDVRRLLGILLVETHASMQLWSIIGWRENIFINSNLFIR